MSKNTCMRKEIGWDKIKHVYLYTICALTISVYRRSDKQEVNIIMRRVEMGKSDACVHIYSDREMGNRIHVFIIINMRNVHVREYNEYEYLPPCGYKGCDEIESLVRRRDGK